MGIASSVVETVKTELTRHPGQRVSAVGLRIGEFAGVDTESLRFCFEVICRSEQLHPISLEIEWCLLGEELDVAYLELDEPLSLEAAEQVA